MPNRYIDIHKGNNRGIFNIIASYKDVILSYLVFNDQAIILIN